MLSTQREFLPPGFDSWTAIGLFAIVLVFLLTTLAWSQEHDMGSMPGMHRNGPATYEDPAQEVKHRADRMESEFNHHLAGWLVIVAGIFILSESYLSKRWPLIRYAWPMCFIVVGLFVLIFSDTEIWPFGPQTPWYALMHNREDLQHKVFSIILLAIGYVELQRARGRLRAPWAAWFFPTAGVVGAILLLFHVHSGDMQAPHAMETMERIQKQHHWFATIGLGVAVANGLAGTSQKWKQLFMMAWPALLVVLGFLLAQYTE
jgi:copper resistance protein D